MDDFKTRCEEQLSEIPQEKQPYIGGRILREMGKRIAGIKEEIGPIDSRLNEIAFQRLHEQDGLTKAESDALGGEFSELLTQRERLIQEQDRLTERRSQYQQFSETLRPQASFIITR